MHLFIFLLAICLASFTSQLASGYSGDCHCSTSRGGLSTLFCEGETLDGADFRKCSNAQVLILQNIQWNGFHLHNLTDVLPKLQDVELDLSPKACEEFCIGPNALASYSHNCDCETARKGASHGDPSSTPAMDSGDIELSSTPPMQKNTSMEVTDRKTTAITWIGFIGFVAILVFMLAAIGWYIWHQRKCRHSQRDRNNSDTHSGRVRNNSGHRVHDVQYNRQTSTVSWPDQTQSTIPKVRQPISPIFAPPSPSSSPNCTIPTPLSDNQEPAKQPLLQDEQKVEDSFPNEAFPTANANLTR